MPNDDTNYLSVLLEEFKSQNTAIRKAVADMRTELKSVPKREEFDELKQDVKIIKASVIDLSHQVHNHEHRISSLEAA